MVSTHGDVPPQNDNDDHDNTLVGPLGVPLRALAIAEEIYSDPATVFPPFDVAEPVGDWRGISGFPRYINGGENPRSRGNDQYLSKQGKVYTILSRSMKAEQRQNERDQAREVERRQRDLLRRNAVQRSLQERASILAAQEVAKISSADHHRQCIEFAKSAHGSQLGAKLGQYPRMYTRPT